MIYLIIYAFITTFYIGVLVSKPNEELIEARKIIKKLKIFLKSKKTININNKIINFNDLTINK